MKQVGCHKSKDDKRYSVELKLCPESGTLTPFLEIEVAWHTRNYEPTFNIVTLNRQQAKALYDLLKGEFENEDHN